MMKRRKGETMPGKSWRDDPSVKWALSKRGGMQPWDVMLVNCPAAPCGAQNYFCPTVTKHCRICGALIEDRADEMYSVGVAMELEMEELRQEAIGGIEDIIQSPIVVEPDEVQAPPGAAERDAEQYRVGNRILTALWIALCIGFVAALAAVMNCRDGKF